MPPDRIPGILVLHRNNLAPTAAMVMELVDAFSRHSRFKAWAINTHLGFPAVLRDLEFSVIVLHYSLFAYLPFLEDEFRAYLADSTASYKVAFFQDEYRFWPERAEVLDRFHVDCVYTCLEPAHYAATYRKHTAVPRLETYLPGYVSDEMLRHAAAAAKPDAARTIDVGYRGRLSPEFIFLGRGALEKYEIGLRFRDMAADAGLALDIETDELKRIYGRPWLEFLGNCRAVLGVEAGVSIFDIDNDILPRYERFRAAHPECSLEDAYDAVLAPHDGHGIYYRTISPRVFEAAAVHACQILYEGHYSGILQPEVHYIPLKKDFSNFADVLRAYRDPGLRRTLTDNCHRDLIASGAYSYGRFIEQFDAGLLGAGLTAEIPLGLARQVHEQITGAQQRHMQQKLTTQVTDYQALLATHVALQGQYMDQQARLNELLGGHLPGVRSLLRVWWRRFAYRFADRVADALRPYPIAYRWARGLRRAWPRS